MQASATPTDARSERGWSTLFLVIAALIALLVLVQALLAGEWLAGKQTMDVHQANGGIIFLLSLVQVGVVAVTVKGPRRRLALITTVVFVLLTVLQLALGTNGFDSPNQARALHIPNGILLFGLAIWNVTLARRR